MTLVKFGHRLDEQRLNRSVNKLFGEMPDCFRADSVLFPRVDIFEYDKVLNINVELPGIKKEDVKLVIENGLLNISGKKENKMENNDEPKVLKSEIFKGSFNRSFKLSDDYDSENIKAEFENGILSVTIGKRKEVEPTERVIKIN